MSTQGSEAQLVALLGAAVDVTPLWLPPDYPLWKSPAGAILGGLPGPCCSGCAVGTQDKKAQLAALLAALAGAVLRPLRCEHPGQESPAGGPPGSLLAAWPVPCSVCCTVITQGRKAQLAAFWRPGRGCAPSAAP